MYLKGRGVGCRMHLKDPGKSYISGPEEAGLHIGHDNRGDRLVSQSLRPSSLGLRGLGFRV